MSGRYSVTAGERVSQPVAIATLPVQAPGRRECLLPLLDAQSLATEAIEQLIRWDDVDLDQVDSLLGDAMRRLAKARSAVADLRRAKLGQPTIASTG